MRNALHYRRTLHILLLHLLPSSLYLVLTPTLVILSHLLSQFIVILALNNVKSLKYLSQGSPNRSMAYMGYVCYTEYFSRQVRGKLLGRTKESLWGSVVRLLSLFALLSGLRRRRRSARNGFYITGRVRAAVARR